MTVDIDKLSMDILINCPIGAIASLRMFFWVGGWWVGERGFDRHHGLTVQKPHAGLGSACSQAVHSPARCPLTTLSRAVGLVSRSSLIARNQTLKEGGSRYMGWLVKPGGIWAPNGDKEPEGSK